MNTFQLFDRFILFLISNIVPVVHKIKVWTTFVFFNIVFYLFPFFIGMIIIWSMIIVFLFLLHFILVIWFLYLDMIVFPWWVIEVSSHHIPIKTKWTPLKCYVKQIVFIYFWFDLANVLQNKYAKWLFVVDYLYWNIRCKLHFSYNLKIQNYFLFRKGLLLFILWPMGALEIGLEASYIQLDNRLMQLFRTSCQLSVSLGFLIYSFSWLEVGIFDNM